MRLIIAIVLLSVLAACQTPASDPGVKPAQSTDGADSAMQMPGQKSRFFSTESEALQDEMTKRLVVACAARSNSRPAFDKCFRDYIVETFDDSGQGSKNCQQRPDIDKFSECVLIGNIFISVIHQLDANATVADDFWASRDTMQKAFQRTAIAGVVDSCAKFKSDSAVSTCSQNWFERKLDVPSDLIEHCKAQLSNSDTEACLGEAVSLNFMRQHLAKAPTVGA